MRCQPRCGGTSVYAYCVAALREFVSWPPSALERTESFEQLRLLEHGRGIVVCEAAAAVPGGVDTPADAERVRELLSRRSRVPRSVDAELAVHMPK